MASCVDVPCRANSAPHVRRLPCFQLVRGRPRPQRRRRARPGRPSMRLQARRRRGARGGRAGRTSSSSRRTRSRTSTCASFATTSERSTAPSRATSRTAPPSAAGTTRRRSGRGCCSTARSTASTAWRRAQPRSCGATTSTRTSSGGRAAHGAEAAIWSERDVERVFPVAHAMTGGGATTAPTRATTTELPAQRPLVPHVVPRVERHVRPRVPERALLLRLEPDVPYAGRDLLPSLVQRAAMTKVAGRALAVVQPRTTPSSSPRPM